MSDETPPPHLEDDLEQRDPRFSFATLAFFCTLGYIIFAVLIASLCFVSVAAYEAREVAKANDDFAGRLYSHMVGKGADTEQCEKCGNMVVSPFSISTVMSMVYAGARGETARQIKKGMAFPHKDRVFYGYRKILNNLKFKNKDITLEAANKLFVQSGYTPQADYLDLMRKYYQTGPEIVNFEKSSDASSSEATELINQWVKEQTNNKISELLPPSGLAPWTRLVLVNAVYFKGYWRNKFRASNTKKQAFTLLNGTNVQVDMMRQTARFRGAQLKELGCTVLQMPYRGDELRMMVFLSDDPEGFYAMEERLAGLDIGRLKLGRRTAWNVSLPKFKFESFHNLVPSLRAMGMTHLFNPVEADLSGITGNRSLSVSSVFQRASIEVDERGSKAAAATGVVITKKSAGGQTTTPSEFTCDRPFLFVIRDKLTGVVLFRGRVVDPRQLT